jgi:sugar phosphate isomerase/epimerase
MRCVRLSIGSWAYCFGPYQEHPVPFETVIRELGRLGFAGIELGAFLPHPHPGQFDTKEKRIELKKKVAGEGLAFSGIAADLWSCPIIPLADHSKWMKAFEQNLEFASDLGIDCIRVDSVSPPDVFETEVLDPKLAWQRLVNTFQEGARKAADCGIRMVWEFEPGFAFNKPSEIIGLVDDVGHDNFRVLYDTCHAHMCAAVGARQPGTKETLAGGALELLGRLRGKIGHVHLIDSDSTLHNNETSTHAPFGKGVLDFDALIPEILRCGCPANWWTIDLCFWPNAWEATADCKRFLEGMARRYVGQPSPA